jgi:hypothetical protein
MKRFTLGSSLFRHARLTMALVSLAIAAPVTLAAGPQGPPEDRGDRGGPADPCTQAAEAPGKAKGLERRCEHGPSSGGQARGDFNGDGYADLAIGTPYEDVGTIRDAGTVNIIYGTATGLTATAIADQSFNFSNDTDAHFGWALAAGLFNDDIYSDLAIGAPGLTSEGGGVYVIYGSANGLQSTYSDFFGGGGQAGASLVWADFNGDGFGDLAVGHPLKTVLGDGFACSQVRFEVREAGEVRVYYGSPDGLTTFGRQIFRQGGCTYSDGIGVGDSPEEDDHFGYALAAMSVQGAVVDVANLVIGVPYEDLALFDKREAGLLHVIPGFAPNGLDHRFTQTLTQDTAGVADVAETGDYFGVVLATGDFDGDAQDDLAVGLPWEDVGSGVDAGAVQVFFAGGFDPVTTDGDMFIHQGNLDGVAIEDGDRMGWALAAGRFDGDTREDLAVGVPREDISSNTNSNAGIVIVLYGSSSGPSLTDIQIWSQTGTGSDLSEPGDEFGRALSAWNYGNSDRADLAIGVPFEDVPAGGTGSLLIDAGAVSVIYGTTNGLTATGSQFWHQDTDGVNGTAEPGDRFGNALY